MRKRNVIYCIFTIFIPWPSKNCVILERNIYNLCSIILNYNFWSSTYKHTSVVFIKTEGLFKSCKIVFPAEKIASYKTIRSILFISNIKPLNYFFSVSDNVIIKELCGNANNLTELDNWSNYLIMIITCHSTDAF